MSEILRIVNILTKSSKICTYFLSIWIRTLELNKKSSEVYKIEHKIEHSGVYWASKDYNKRTFRSICVCLGLPRGPSATKKAQRRMQIKTKWFRALNFTIPHCFRKNTKNALLFRENSRKAWNILEYHNNSKKS